MGFGHVKFGMPPLILHELAKFVGDAVGAQ